MNKQTYSYTKMLTLNTALKISLVSSMACLLFFTSCKKKENQFDATGSFEAIETIISAEANGTLLSFQINEGQEVKTGQLVGAIDSTQLFLKKKQLEAQMIALVGKKPQVNTQLAGLKSQLNTANRERQRISNLVSEDAVPAKQLDDINAQIDLITKQIAAQKSTLDLSVSGIDKEVQPLQVQLEQVEDQLAKCSIINPVNGTVLTKYAEEKEMTAAGKPLYKIADLSHIILRAYLSGDQLAKVKLNQKVKVLTDDGDGGYKETLGTITWINNKAEFTPKTIQTKNERANMVYATKILVKNDGTYKIGMYGEIKF